MKLRTKIATILLGIGLATSMAFADGSKCGGDTKAKTEKCSSGKCGAGKCGGDMNKSKKGKCCADKKKGDMKAKSGKCKSGKCGSGKCGGDTKAKKN